VPHSPLLARVNGPWVALLTLVLVVGVLWAAKAVLMPLALGIVLAFMLTPLVRQFDRWRLPRFAGVTLTMLLALGAVGGIGYVVFDQFVDLSTQITQYTSSMRRKVADLRLGNDAALRQFTRTVDRVTEQLDENATELRRAQPVRVVPARVTPIERLHETANMVFEPLASAFIVIVLVAFMLGQREDLRDRFIRLIGANNVTLTTRLMDEAAHRVSQFLVWQTLINIAFGAVIAAGLYWIGVPYAALWGGLTAVLRFVPYVGTLLSASIPAMLAFATFPGWAETLQTLALFLSLDLMTAYFAEPVVFGQRTGVSSFALLISALFWIWVWGPVGLLLATPLTVCIAVLGRHVRSLRFLAIIFADEPALLPHVRFYQRLLARDEDEAASLIERKLGEIGPVGVIDEMLIPAVTLVIQHRSQNEITKEDAEFILEVTAETVQQMPVAANSGDTRPAAGIVGLTTRSPVDKVVLQMLGAALGHDRIELVPADTSADAAVAHVMQQRPAVICIVAISPTRGSEVRNYCRRVRGALPETRILVLRPPLTDTDASRSAARMKDAGADMVVTTTKDAVDAIDDLLTRTRRPKVVAMGAALEAAEESRLAQS
jgi:predicted PurR-regulated permease PerM/methylmalonyl-CoA mutase cobalamin-binding subunit